MVWCRGGVRGRGGREGLFPLDMCPLHFVSVTPAELIGFTFTLVYVLTSSRSAALRVCSVQLRQSGALQNSYTGLLYVWRMSELKNVLLEIIGADKSSLFCHS